MVQVHPAAPFERLLTMFCPQCGNKCYMLTPMGWTCRDSNTCGWVDKESAKIIRDALIEHFNKRV